MFPFLPQDIPVFWGKDERTDYSQLSYIWLSLSPLFLLLLSFARLTLCSAVPLISYLFCHHCFQFGTYQEKQLLTNHIVKIIQKQRITQFSSSSSPCNAKHSINELKTSKEGKICHSSSSVFRIKGKDCILVLTNLDQLRRSSSERLNVLVRIAILLL